MNRISYITLALSCFATLTGVAGRTMITRIAHPASKEIDSDDIVLVEEDFSLMSEGSVEQPDSRHLIDIANEDIYIPDEYTHTPGWSGTGVFQAGGAVALNYPDYGGYINTPEGDYSGTLHISARVKALSNNTDKIVSINTGVSAGGVNSSSPRVLAYKMFDIPVDSEEWTLITWDVDIKESAEDEFIQFNTYNYVAIDDIKVTCTMNSLPAPKLLEATSHVVDGFTANWTPVGHAEAYLLSVYHEEPIGGEDGIREYRESFEDVNADGTDLDYDDPNLPDGWTFNPDEYDQLYIDEGWTADGKYALRISSDYDVVEMPNNGGRYLTLTFQARAKKGEDDFPGKIYIYGYDGYKWVNPRGTYYFFQNDEWRTIDLSSLVGGKYYAVKLVFKDFDDCEIALDDFQWTTTAPAERKMDIEDLRVESVSQEVRGLDPYTDYFYTVKSISDSKGLDSGEPTSAMSAFGVAAPEILDASDITTKSYTANWNSVPKATEFQVYNYSVFKADNDIKGYEVLSESFEKLADSPLVDLENMDLISLDEYTGRMGWYGFMTLVGLGGLGATGDPDFGVGGQLQTPELSLSNNDGKYDVKVKLLGEPGDKIVVQNSKGERNYIEVEGETAEATLHFHEGIECDVLTFYSYESANFLIQDIKVLQDLKAGDMVATMIDCDYAKGLSYTFKVPEGVNYLAYDVQSIYDKYYSSAWSDRSERSYVKLPDAGIHTPGEEIEGSAVEIYTVSGILVGVLKDGQTIENLNLTPGLYIERCGNRVNKTVVK